jgi:hypothetical protein
MSNYYIVCKGQGFFYAFNFTSGGWNVKVGFTSSNADIPAGLGDGIMSLLLQQIVCHGKFLLTRHDRNY